jgi:hypothetical protein
VFDYLLLAGVTRSRRPVRELIPSGGDWYAEVAPRQYQALYEEVHRSIREWGEHAPYAGDVRVPGDSDDADAPRAASRRNGAGIRPLAGGPVSLPGLDEAAPGAAGASGRAGSPRDRGAPPSVLRSLPARAVDLTSDQRDALGRWLRPGWPPGAKAAYAELSSAVSSLSVRRWEQSMDRGGGSGEAMLWRLLRMGSAPYFVLGSSSTRSLRLRIATSWDWRQRYVLGSISMTDQRGGQPRVRWDALVRDRATNELHEVTGHIEVRWSHGRFGAPPEAKGYLDTPHHLVPGYFPLR